MKKHAGIAAAVGAVAAAAAVWSYAAPDARPAVLGAIETKGITGLVEFKAGSEVRGFAGMGGRDPMAVYVLKDGTAIVGTRVDARGEPLDVAAIDDLVAKPMGDAAWKRLESAHWIRDGREDAPRIVYVFTDPNCPWCHRLWEATRPWVASGKVQIRHLLVGVIRADSEAKAAAILSAPNPANAMERNELDYSKRGIQALKAIPAEAKQALQGNLKAMGDLGFRGTPALVYRGADGRVDTLSGFPQGDQMLKVFGPK